MFDDMATVKQLDRKLGAEQVRKIVGLFEQRTGGKEALRFFDWATVAEVLIDPNSMRRYFVRLNFS